MTLTGDFRMLKALAHQHGFLLVESPAQEASDRDLEILEQLIGARAAGGVHAHHADADLAANSRINERERRATQAAERALQAFAATLPPSCRRGAAKPLHQTQGS